MEFRFVTLFPETVLSAVRHSILKRAEDSGLLSFDAINPRDFAGDKHRTVDDEPYGGGPGMVLKADVVGAAVESALAPHRNSAVVFPDPAGELFSQAAARELATYERVVFVCGHYEGIDERVPERYATHRFSLGDYILSGGELPAAIMADAVGRLVHGVVGDPASLEADAFSDGLLTYPQYTRPPVWNGVEVPAVLLSGDHEAVFRWRRAHRLWATRKRRPDLFAKAPLSKTDLKLLQLPFPGDSTDV
jgi:tRNA (guanine37-N1)-methyltransferase